MSLVIYPFAFIMADDLERSLMSAKCSPIVDDDPDLWKPYP